MGEIRCYRQPTRQGPGRRLLPRLRWQNPPDRARRHERDQGQGPSTRGVPGSRRGIGRGRHHPRVDGRRCRRAVVVRRCCRRGRRGQVTDDRRAVPEPAGPARPAGTGCPSSTGAVGVPGRPLPARRRPAEGSQHCQERAVGVVRRARPSGAPGRPARQPRPRRRPGPSPGQGTPRPDPAGGAPVAGALGAGREGLGARPAGPCRPSHRNRPSDRGGGRADMACRRPGRRHRRGTRDSGPRGRRRPPVEAAPEVASGVAGRRAAVMDRGHAPSSVP